MRVLTLPLALLAACLIGLAWVVALWWLTARMVVSYLRERVRWVEVYE